MTNIACDRPRRGGQIGDRIMNCLGHGRTDHEAQATGHGFHVEQGAQ